MKASSPRSRSECAHDLLEVVDSTQWLHHHALVTKVVAPHPLDELGVVDALDEDAARPRYPRPEAVDRNRSRRRDPGGCFGATSGRGHQQNRFVVDEKSARVVSESAMRKARSVAVCGGLSACSD